MMRFALLILLLVILPVDAGAQSYRNFVWGVSPQDVRKFEIALFYEETDDSISFLDDQPNRQVRAIIKYDFADNKLWRISYSYSQLHKPNSQMVLDMMGEEERKLTRIYGEPVDAVLVWKNRYYRSYPKFYPRAYASGDLTFRTEWEKGGTHATLESYHDGDFYRLGYVLEEAKARVRSNKAKTFNFNLQPQ